VKYPWVTPVSDYRDFGGWRLPAYGEAIWKQPDGDLVYGRFQIEDIQYNVGQRARAPGLASHVTLAPSTF
jgi:hypothetical protein